MEQPKEYYAFISYKRDDKKEAKRLQHALEYYRLPNHLRQEDPELPEYVRPVFRDMTDLEVGELSAQIHSALEQSHFLIVVCSPRVAASKWVNDEVEYFISLGKQDKIIPYIIEGVPHACNPSEECYPPALLRLSREKELLGANINEVGKDSATIRVVSRMFNIRFDTLYQRYQREQKRKRWMWIGGSILIALLGLSIGGYFVRQNGIIERQNERLQQDSITMADHLQKISAQNDSIASQNDLILSQRDSIEHSVKQLQLSNRLLAEERDNVLKANWQAKGNYARAVAREASRLCVEGNAYGAIDMLLNVIPNKDNHYNYPKIPEVEASFRQANDSVLYSKGAIGLIRKHHRDEIMSLSISESNRLITGYSSNEACSWNLDTGQEETFLHIKLNNRCTNTLITSNGKNVFAGCKGELKAKTIQSNGSVTETTITNSFDGLSYNALQMSSDNTYIVYKDLGGTYRFVSVESLKEFWVVKHQSQLVLCPNNRYAISSSNDSILTIWDIYERKGVSTFNADCFIGKMTELFVSDNGYFLKAEGYGKTNIWNITTGQKSNRNSPVFSQQHNNIHVLGSFRKEGEVENTSYIAHVQENGNVSIYKKKSKKRKFDFVSYKSDSLIFNHSFTMYLPYSYSEKDCILKVSGQKINIPFERPIGGIYAYFQPYFEINETMNYIVVCYPNNKNAYIWDLQNHKIFGKLPHDSDIKAVSFSSNSQYVITQTNDGYSHFWNVENFKERFAIKSNYWQPMDMSFDNKYVYNLGASISVWNTNNGKKIKNKILLESDNPSSINLNRGNTYFLTSDNKYIKLWDFETGIELWRYYLNNSDDVNNKYYINFCEGGIRILNKEYGKTPKSFFMELDDFDVLVDKYRRLYNR